MSLTVITSDQGLTNLTFQSPHYIQPTLNKRVLSLGKKQIWKQFL